MAYNLVGIDGNAYSIMGYVSKCMRREHYSQKDIHDYIKKATSSDYDNLLRVSIDMIDKLNEGKPQDPEDDEWINESFEESSFDKDDSEESYFDTMSRADADYKAVSEWVTNTIKFDSINYTPNSANDPKNVKWHFDYERTSRGLEVDLIIDDDNTYDVQRTIRNGYFVINAGGKWKYDRIGPRSDTSFEYSDRIDKDEMDRFRKTKRGNVWEEIPKHHWYKQGEHQEEYIFPHGIKLRNCGAGLMARNLGLYNMDCLPRKVRGPWLILSDNNFTSLEGGPELYADDNLYGYRIDFSGNDITSLEGLDKIIGNVKFVDYLGFFHNDLTDFTGWPEGLSVSNLDVRDNNIRSMKGFPTNDFHGSLDISDNYLESLEGMPLNARAINAKYNYIPSTMNMKKYVMNKADKNDLTHDILARQRQRSDDKLYPQRSRKNRPVFESFDNNIDFDNTDNNQNYFDSFSKDDVNYKKEWVGFKGIFRNMLKTAFTYNGDMIVFNGTWEDEKQRSYYENIWKKVIKVNPEDNTIIWNEDYENGMYDLEWDEWRALQLSLADLIKYHPDELDDLLMGYKIKEYYGELDLSDLDVIDFAKLPREIYGSLYISNTDKFINWDQFPEKITDELRLDDIYNIWCMNNPMGTFKDDFYYGWVNSIRLIKDLTTYIHQDDLVIEFENQEECAMCLIEKADVCGTQTTIKSLRDALPEIIEQHKNKKWLEQWNEYKEELEEEDEEEDDFEGGKNIDESLNESYIYSSWDGTPSKEHNIATWILDHADLFFIGRYSNIKPTEDDVFVDPDNHEIRIRFTSDKSKQFEMICKTLNDKFGLDSSDSRKTDEFFWTHTETQGWGNRWTYTIKVPTIL